MLAVYPGITHAYPVTQAQLVAAWFRRKRMEARMIANELARVFGATEPDVVPDDEVDISTMGFSVKRIDVRQDDATTG